MKTIELVQGSPEWHSWRMKKIGASESPIILGEDANRTIYDLWGEKSGRNGGVETNYVMAKGKALEPLVREKLRESLGFDLLPLCGENENEPLFSASFDGISPSGETVVEIKYVGKKVFEAAQHGQIPDAHRTQVNHQLFVSGAPKGVYACTIDGEQVAQVAILPDEETIKRIYSEGLNFWNHVEEDLPPPLTEKDYLFTDNGLWLEKAAEWSELDGLEKQIKEKKETIRQELIRTAPSHNKIQGGGVLLYKTSRNSTDYKSLMKAFGISDAEKKKFQKTSESWTLKRKGGSK